MRYAGSIGKGNINLLYNDFRTVEDFDRETQERLGFSTTPTSIKTPKIKKDFTKDMSHLSQTNDEFDLLSLEQQIELVMQPVINPGLSPEALQRHLQDLESSRISSKELGRNTIDNTATPEEDSKIILEEDGGRELNSHEVTSRGFENSKYNVSLPPIKESDPFSSNQVIKHWHYHQPVKYNSMKQHSTSVVGISDSYRRFPNETHIDQNKSLFSNVKNRSPPGTLRTESHPGKSQRYINMPGGSPRSGALKNAGLASILQPVEGSANQFNMHIAANPEASSLLEQLNDPKIISTEGIIPSRRVNFLQDASYEANHLLNKGPIRGNMNPSGKNLLEKNQARSQQLLTDSDKRSLNFIGEEDRVFELELPSGSIHSSKLERIVSEKKGNYYLPVIVDKKVSRSPPKRKEFYNRWYVPVKYWNKAKDNNQLEKKYEELKKDNNYYYHNLHNYSLQNNGNPLKGQESKSNHQLNYESMQEKLKQNVTIRKYKKQLAESHQRIPNFLKSIEENQKS